MSRLSGTFGSSIDLRNSGRNRSASRRALRCSLPITGGERIKGPAPPFGVQAARPGGARLLFCKASARPPQPAGRPAARLEDRHGQARPPEDHPSQVRAARAAVLARGRGHRHRGSGGLSPLRRGAGAALLLCVASLGAWAPRAVAAGAPVRNPVVIAFLPVGEPQLASVKGLSVGIMSATQGSYRTPQLLLDITQGARVSSSAYPYPPPALSLARTGAGAVVVGWRAARRRAEAAPQLLQPGLLAAQVPGGGGYVGTTGENDLDGGVAADREGRAARVSLGTRRALPAGRGA